GAVRLMGHDQRLPVAEAVDRALQVLADGLAKKRDRAGAVDVRDHFEPPGVAVSSEAVGQRKAWRPEPTSRRVPSGRSTSATAPAGTSNSKSTVPFSTFQAERIEPRGDS